MADKPFGEKMANILKAWKYKNEIAKNLKELNKEPKTIPSHMNCSNFIF